MIPQKMDNNLPSFERAAGPNNSGYVEFEMRERGSLFKGMDWLGYVPVVGSAVGICRVIAGISYGVFSKICKKDSPGNWRGGQEAMRGLFELLPFFTICADIAEAKGWAAWSDTGCGKYYLVEKGRESEEGICCWDKQPSERLMKIWGISNKIFKPE